MYNKLCPWSNLLPIWTLYNSTFSANLAYLNNHAHIEQKICSFFNITFKQFFAFCSLFPIFFVPFILGILILHISDMW